MTAIARWTLEGAGIRVMITGLPYEFGRRLWENVGALQGYPSVGQRVPCSSFLEYFFRYEDAELLRDHPWYAVHAYWGETRSFLDLVRAELEGCFGETLLIIEEENLSTEYILAQMGR